jgi:hypothetical protein
LGDAIVGVGAVLDVEGILEDLNAFEFTVTGIRRQSDHPDVFLGNDNIGVVYRGAVGHDSIIGQVYADPTVRAGTVTFMFARPRIASAMVAVQPAAAPAAVEAVVARRAPAVIAHTQLVVDHGDDELFVD